MSGFDITAATPILKQYYTPMKVESLVFESPTLALLPKETDGSGSAYIGAIRSAIGSTVSSTDTVAFTATAASQYNQWTCPWRSGYARALVSGSALDQTGNDKGAFVKAVISETESAYKQIADQLGVGIFGNGGGARGQIASTSTVNTTVITLSNASDAIKFRIGQVLQASSDDGTGGAGVRTGTVTVAAVDMFAGTVTATGNWNSGISAITAGDYLFAQGDYALVFQGIPAWIVPNSKRGLPAFTSSFNGVPRTIDPIRLGGVPYTGSGAPKKESLIQLGMMLARMGAKPSHIILNHLDFADIQKDLTTNSQIVNESAYKNPQIGFPALQVSLPFGTVKIMVDPYCQQGTGWILDMKTWKLPSMGGLPKVDFLDKLNWLRTAGADAYEFRTLYRCATYCSMPGHNGVVEF